MPPPPTDPACSPRALTTTAPSAPLPRTQKNEGEGDVAAVAAAALRGRTSKVLCLLLLVPPSGPIFSSYCKPPFPSALFVSLRSPVIHFYSSLTTLHIPSSCLPSENTRAVALLHVPPLFSSRSSPPFTALPPAAPRMLLPFPFTATIHPPSSARIHMLVRRIFPVFSHTAPSSAPSFIPPLPRSSIPPIVSNVASPTASLRSTRLFPLCPLRAPTMTRPVSLFTVRAFSVYSSNTLASSFLYIPLPSAYIYYPSDGLITVRVQIVMARARQSRGLILYRLPRRGADDPAVSPQHTNLLRKEQGPRSSHAHTMSIFQS
ncbi:hypothetical protein B0H10DRAFT_606988 [Mycena sp. CBHHK59/15]|nr:hypothetical protein B0H10DRAFT_606988 [Mycena sp. CBHHK59/15]